MNTIKNSLLLAALLVGGSQHATAQHSSLGFELMEAAVAVTTGSQDGSQDGSQAPSLHARYYPTPTSGLTLPAGGLSIEQLLERFSDVTGETLVWSQDTAALLRMTKLPLQRDLEIAPDDVYSVVQDLLSTSRFMLSSLRREEPRMLAVASLDSPARAGIKKGALYLPLSDVPDFAGDSAQIFQTVVPMPHSNLSQIDGSLRQLVIDPNVTQLVSFRDLHQVVITADGRRLATYVDILRAIDDGVRRRAEGQAPSRSAASGGALRDRQFPAPNSGLTIRAEDQSVAQLLDEYAVVTGEHVLWSQDIEALLQSQMNLVQGEDLQVAPEEVRSVVQSVLAAHRYVMKTVRREEPRLSVVVSLDSPARASLRQDALFVPQAEVRPFAADPAILISTVVSLEHVDTIGSALRQLVVDPNTLQIVALDTTGQVIVTGLTSETVRIVELLESLDAEHGVQSEARRAAEEEAQANAPQEAEDEGEDETP